MQERNRIARDLHDSVSQSLFGATMFADSAQAQIDAGQVDQAAESITKLGNAARIALGEMRLLIYELRPPLLESEGLAAALIARLETVERRAGFQLELDIQEVEGLSLEEEQQVYSIAVEALNNILKHAQAEKIRVCLDQEGNRCQLQISDDGVGFEPEKAYESGGIGIASMHERAALLGAHLVFQSDPGSGTKLVLTMERQL
jgi:signal transduction histidine kinase